MSSSVINHLTHLMPITGTVVIRSASSQACLGLIALKTTWNPLTNVTMYLLMLRPFHTVLTKYVYSMHRANIVHSIFR
jgi:hypothetical protein